MSLSPHIEALIEYRAAAAIEEVEKAADRALLELGFTPEFVRRSRGQKRRFQRQQKGNQ